MSVPHRIRPVVNVVVVERDAEIAEQIDILVRQWGFDVRFARDGRAARATLAAWAPRIAIVDRKLACEDEDLQVVLRTPGLECIVTAWPADQALDLGRSGSSVALTLDKPVRVHALRHVLHEAQERLERGADAPLVSRHQRLGDLVSESPKMTDVFELIRCVAPTEANVLITGENGTGKELVANAIHALSARRDGPFIKVNCAAIPDELIESELFGHRRGAFTGAVGDHTGLFESAAGGTVLLDEIGEMRPHLQSKLLRVLQERQARPVGGVRTVPLDFRLICATNCDLRSLATSGEFRQDLYFRINTVGIAVPPLRERVEDILPLATHFVERYGRRYGRPAQVLQPAAREALLRGEWRGNVRELEHAIERAVIVARGDAIGLEHLPETLRVPKRPRVETTESPIMPLAELERMAIMRTLEHTRGNKRAAAALLGVYRPTLYSKLRKYGISDAALGAGAMRRDNRRPEAHAVNG